MRNVIIIRSQKQFIRPKRPINFTFSLKSHYIKSTLLMVMHCYETKQFKVVLHTKVLNNQVYKINENLRLPFHVIS